jgi:hypothetical protein
MLEDGGVARCPHTTCYILMRQQVDDVLGAARYIEHQKAGLSILYLQPDAPAVAPNHGCPFPHGFGHRQAKSL